MLAVSLALGALRPMRAESTTAAATALVVLLAGYSEDGSMLLARLADTFVGIGVGLVVNLVVWPPLRDRSAARRVDVLDDRVGELLEEMAGGLPATTRPIPRPGCSALALSTAGSTRPGPTSARRRESGRLNVRRQAARRSAPAPTSAPSCTGSSRPSPTRAAWRGRSAAPGRSPAGRPVPRGLAELLRRAADAVLQADAAAVGRVCADLEGRAAAGGVATRPAHGALVVNLRNILDAMRSVAAAQPVRVRARSRYG